MSGRELSYTVPAEDAGRRARSVLQRELKLSAGLVTRLKQREGAVKINGKPARTTDVLSAGDVLTAEVGDVRPGGLFAPSTHLPEVLFEDEDFIILNKPAGVATHGRSERGETTVAGMLAAYLGTESPFHPVNRLDRGTTGVMCVAKTGYAHDRLRRLLHSESFVRDYIAIAVGEVSPPSGVITLPIVKIGEKKFGTRPDGAPSITKYETIKSSGGLTLLRVAPETGRTHQIRVHLAALGFPLLGDALYGRPSDELARPALHSASLFLLHPLTGDELRVSAPLPEDMRAVMESHGLSL